MFNDIQETESLAPFHMLVVGVGHAGCRILSDAKASGRPLPDTVGIHTSRQALADCSLDRALQLGAGVVEGASTGGDLKLGRICAEQDEALLRDLFHGYDLVLFVIGLGGGTGSGATPVMARLARDVKCFTVCIAVSPFKFEMEDRRRKAEIGLATLRDHIDAVVCFPNERLFSLMHGRKDLDLGIQTANHFLIGVVTSLYELLRGQGMLSLDFGDLKTLVQNSDGTCSIVHAQADGSDAAAKVVEQLLASPLLDHGSVLSKAMGLIIGIRGGVGLPLTVVDEVVQRISAVAHVNAKFQVGVSIDPSLANELEVTLICSETWRPARALPLEEPVEAGDAQAKADSKRQLVQAEIELDTSGGKGKFMNVAPTIHDGEDLDFPAFMRKKIKLSRHY
jgi:cell division protein FtsZ